MAAMGIGLYVIISIFCGLNNRHTMDWKKASRRKHWAKHLIFQILVVGKVMQARPDYFDIIFCIKDIIPALATFMAPD
jgi:hypothetical protein